MWLIDTNVVSELARPKPDRNVVSFLSEQSMRSLYLSAVTMGEIRFGISQIDDPLKREQRTNWLTTAIRPLFQGRILDLRENEIVQWRLLIAHGKNIRRTFSQPDLFIAASALVNSLKLVTRNVRDFVPTGVPIVNPWTGERFNGA